ncbi:MAG: ABC transporter permease [Polyangiaceae bacterium]|nr:ABC transporter permease [Polyangiaceae bacterium]
MRRLAIAFVKRVLVAGAIVWGVTTATWFLTAALPGDPVRAVLGPTASPADVERARHVWGLDQPLYVRYVHFLERLIHRSSETPGTPKSDHASCGRLVGSVHVDLGRSHIYNAPVVDLIEKKLPYSLRLALAAMAVQIVIGFGLGVFTAMRRGSRADELVLAASTALSAAPTFVIGLVLQYFLAHRLGWVPLDGLGVGPADEARALILPALTLGCYGAAVLTRFVRAELVTALVEPFVRTARAKGASRTRAALVHALRSSIGPIAQLVVLELGALVGGAIVTERLFRWPGLGDMSVAAIQNHDAQALVGVTLVASVVMVVATAIADLLNVALDPRQR